MTDSLTILVQHCATTLPENLSGRKALLLAITHVISRKHPAFRVIDAQLTAIETIERLQAELPFTFDKSETVQPS